MFQGMTNSAQIILSVGMVVTALAVVAVIAIICWKIGIKIGLKQAYVKIGGDLAAEDAMYWLTASDLETIFEIFLEGIEDIVALSRVVSVNKKMDFVEDRLVILTGYLESIYIRLSKNVVSVEILTKHEDYQYYIRFVNRVICGDVGREGVKDITRKYLKSEDYNKNDFSKFVSDFVALVLQIFRSFLHADYDNVVTYEGGTRSRVVSEETLYHELFCTTCIDKLVEIFSGIFNNAKKVDLFVAEQRSIKIAERKKKIKLLACNKDNLKTKGGN